MGDSEQEVKEEKKGKRKYRDEGMERTFHEIVRGGWRVG